MRLPGIDEPTDRVSGDDGGKAADVIGVRVGCHNDVKRLDVSLLEVLNDPLSHSALTGIDEHGLVAESKEDRVALSNVDEVNGKVPGKPGDDLRLLPGIGAAGSKETG